jgi:hypothetical protein
LNASPSVQSSETCPPDLNKFSYSSKAIHGYFLFTVQPAHIKGSFFFLSLGLLKGPTLTQRVIGQMMMFRPYVNYHFKCTKAFTHYRMRTTADGWVQVLNRAKPDRPTTSLYYFIFRFKMICLGIRTITGKLIRGKK